MPPVAPVLPIVPIVFVVPEGATHGEGLFKRRDAGGAPIGVDPGGLSGDYFYMHFDEVAVRESPFGKRIAHGYFVLSAAAGLYVSPAPGPVLANYGCAALRQTGWHGRHD